jgi:NADP-dependent 3-hydroxy acid dehydrogenase YdfG
MDIDLSGSTAIVTGGSKGYGAGIAEALKNRDVSVWITGRDEIALKRTADKIGVLYHRADVTDANDWDSLMRTVIDKDKRIDILVNNAGAGINIAHLDQQEDEEIEHSISVNLTGVILGCRRVIPHMKNQKSGTIINVSSVCANQAWPGWSVYSAAKAGVVQLSNCLYTELREHGVRVTSVIPSWGATRFLSAANLKDFDPETRSKAIQPIELGELIVTICSLPSHLEIQDVTLWPLVQQVEPL